MFVTTIKSPGQSRPGMDVIDTTPPHHCPPSTTPDRKSSQYSYIVESNGISTSPASSTSSKKTPSPAVSHQFIVDRLGLFLTNPAQLFSSKRPRPLVFGPSKSTSAIPTLSTISASSHSRVAYPVSPHSPQLSSSASSSPRGSITRSKTAMAMPSNAADRLRQTIKHERVF